VVSTLLGTGRRVLVHNPEAQGGVSTPDWSPTGTRLVYSWNTPGERGLNIINADGSGGFNQIVSFCGPGTFSPDGRGVAFVKDGLQVVDPDTGAVRTVTADPQAQWYAPDWSPDGRFIVYSVDTSFAVVPAAGGEPVVAQLPATLGQVSAPVFSPDGRRVAFTASESSGETTVTRLYTANRDGSGLTAVAETYGQPTQWLGL
jgi:TolB protein